jgi:hypothetical protein
MWVRAHTGEPSFRKFSRLTVWRTISKHEQRVSPNHAARLLAWSIMSLWLRGVTGVIKRRDA